jgi:hypothetical protein
VSEPIPAEFVGGPIDGQQRWLKPDQNAVDVMEQGAGLEITRRRYERRAIGGIFVRLPNGFYPYDLKGGEA